MKTPMSIALLSCALLASPGMAAPQQPANPDCAVDRAQLMVLDKVHFDEDTTGGGWRTLAARPGCETAAADLLRDYRKAHPKDTGLMIWHEAQLRAFAGQTAQAAALMEQTRMPAAADRMGWNPYVDATIAFLRKDRRALEQAHARLAAVPPPVGKNIPPVVNGSMTVDMSDGTTRQIRFPQNIDVVEGLEQCFDKPYAEAYTSDACRPRAD